MRFIVSKKHKAEGPFLQNQNLTPGQQDLSKWPWSRLSFRPLRVDQFELNVWSNFHFSPSQWGIKTSPPFPDDAIQWRGILWHHIVSSIEIWLEGVTVPPRAMVEKRAVTDGTVPRILVFGWERAAIVPRQRVTRGAWTCTKDTKLIKYQINSGTDQRKNYWRVVDFMHVYNHGYLLLNVPKPSPSRYR